MSSRVWKGGWQRQTNAEWELLTQHLVGVQRQFDKDYKGHLIQRGSRIWDGSKLEIIIFHVVNKIMETLIIEKLQPRAWHLARTQISVEEIPQYPPPPFIHGFTSYDFSYHGQLQSENN